MIKFSTPWKNKRWNFDLIISELLRPKGQKNKNLIGFRDLKHFPSIIVSFLIKIVEYITYFCSKI